ncbi:MAG: universal stress protein [Gammaproteobacteria bacterium]|nr:universal stress protein [Gammaproteobacteria bacterium]
MYTNILHATDLSETHFELCEQALVLANKFEARLHLIHVIEAPASLQVAQGLGFAEMGVPVKDDAEVVMRVLGEALHLPSEQLFVETGSVKQRVLEKIALLNCELLVIGSHRPHELSELLGGIARSLVEHAPSDVLTLRTQR